MSAPARTQAAPSLPSPREVESLLKGKLRRDGSIAFPDPFNPKPNRYPWKFWYRPEQRDGFTVGCAIPGASKEDELRVKDLVHKLFGQVSFQPLPPIHQANGQASTQRPAHSPSDHEELPPTSDEALAIEFAEQHAGILRYTAATGRWSHYDGCCWREEETRLVWDLARALCRRAAATVKGTSEKRDAASAKKRASIVSLAAEDRRLAARVDQWDANLWLLNTPTGVIDLQTGELRAHSAQDYITKTTAVAPTSVGCPRWRQFLDEITDGDEELIKYLQRVAGYLLTGSTREHVLFFLHGIGGNGKSKLVETLAGILGEYHQEAPIATFTASNSDRHPTELARLRGARLVTSSETERGQYWAESKLKAITGGDLIAARYMRQDFFQYRPEFKLLIAGNHKPALRSVGPAMRRRFHLIPFTQQFDGERRDPDLGEKLKAEWPGILQWAIEGCASWLELGLAPPSCRAQHH